MKKLIVCLMIPGAVACAVQRKQTTPKAAVAFVFPDAMRPDVKAQYQEMCTKGYVLYEKNCARCHSATVKGRKIIPDFTAEKMNGYAIRAANKMHEENMPDSMVTAEELGLISTFFAYKKPNASK